MAEGTKTVVLPIRNTLFGFLVVSLLGSFWIEFWMDFGVVLGAKLEPKSIENWSEMVSKIRYDFEWILDGSWIPLGPILEPKLEPSWLQNRSKRGSKPMSKSNQKNDRKLGLQGHAGARRSTQEDAGNFLSGPLRTLKSQDPRDQSPRDSQGLRTLPLGHKARGRIYRI